METPSSRDNRAFFHFERSAKLRNRIKISTFSRSLRSFQAASIDPGIKVVLSFKRHGGGTKSFRKNKGNIFGTEVFSTRMSKTWALLRQELQELQELQEYRSTGRSVNKVFSSHAFPEISLSKWGSRIL
jgi:hypothetical protein